MATKHGREQLSPVKKKFVSPISQRRTSKSSGISPKVRANLSRDSFHKFTQQSKKGELGTRRKLQKDKPINYYLGGNRHDPLNLNSLIDRDPAVNTPQASPSIHGDSPIEVFLPKDCTDPLNLKCFPIHDGKEAIATPKKKKKKKKNKVGQNDIENKEEKAENQNIESKDENTSKKRRRRQRKKKGKKAKAHAENDQTKMPIDAEKSDDCKKEKKVEEGKRISETVTENQNNKVIDENTGSKSEPTKEKKGKQNTSLNGDNGCIEEKRKAKHARNTEVEVNASTKCEPPNKKQRKISSESGENSTKTSTKSERTDETTKIESCAPITETTCSQEGEPSLVNHRTTKKSESSHQDHKQKQKGRVFIHGNYNRYYGYRNSSASEDVRLKSFNKEWFEGKDILDIGCNVGNVTLAIAQEFHPRVIVGSDIDNNLIRLAKNNARNFINQPLTAVTSAGTDFPISFALTSGPLAAPILPNEDLAGSRFPQNVVFKQENFVPPDERALSYQKPMYDTILCLSVTKWVHLNSGDHGLKLMFKRIFRNLRPGGRLILEPQPLSSYRRKKNLTEKIRANYNNIRFKPEHFIDYLLSEEVGFAAFEVLDLQEQKQTGFQRPMYLFTKAAGTSSCSTDTSLAHSHRTKN